MPTLKRKVYTPSDVVTPALLNTPDALVYQIRFTGEVFSLYEDYIERLNTYRERVWACARTGKSNLTYEEAFISERKASANLEPFPDCLHEPVLRIVQHSQLELKSLVDAVHDSLQARFIVGEQVDATIDGTKDVRERAGHSYVVEVLTAAEDPATAPGAAPPHRVPTDDATPAAASPMDTDASPVPAAGAPNGVDAVSSLVPVDPAPAPRFSYTVRILAVTKKTSPLSVGVERTVRHAQLTRRRGAVAKESIKRFIRESAARENYIGSPWIVKEQLSGKLGLPQDLPASLRELRDKYLLRVQAEDARKRQREGDANDEKRLGTEEAKMERKRLKQEARANSKKAEIKYPIEDSELPESTAPPTPRPKASTEFTVPQEQLTDLLVSWVFLQTFARPLSLYPFSLDDLENALRYPQDDCALVYEVHASLLRVLAPSDEPDDDAAESGPAGGRGAFWSGGEVSHENWIGLLQTGVSPSIHARVPNLARALDRGYGPAPMELKISLLCALTDEAISKPALRDYMESSEDALVGLRREKREAEAELRAILRQRDKEERSQLKADGAGSSSSSDSDSDSNGGDDDDDDDAASEEGNDDTPATDGAEPQFVSRTAKLRYHQMIRQRAEMARRKELERAREENRKRTQEIKAVQERARALAQERKQFEQDVATRQRKIASLFDEIQKHRVQRVMPIGRDRHHAQYYFFDGLGGADLSLGAAKLFVRTDRSRWSYYSTPEEIDELIASLNDKGVREFALKNALTENYDRITTAMRKRQKELTQALKGDDARRSTRTSTVSKRQPFMQYYNKWSR